MSEIESTVDSQKHWIQSLKWMIGLIIISNLKWIRFDENSVHHKLFSFFYIKIVTGCLHKPISIKFNLFRQKIK